MKTIDCSVVIVGGGPAGLSAALALAPHTDVLVFDREAEAGGIPRHCAHTGFGLRDQHRSLMGPAYAKRLLDAAIASGARIMTHSMVTGWADDHTLEVTSPQGRMLVKAQAIVLATGARERPRTARRIPGDRAAGVYNTGQLQQAVHLKGQAVGTRAVVVGSEFVSWSAVLTLRHAGCRTVMVTTEYAKPDTYAALAWGGRMLFRPALRMRTRVVRIIGRGRVSGVEIEHLDTGRREVVDCDTVVFTGDWIPDHELVRSAGIALDPKTLGPRVDTALRTERPGVFAVGNLVHAVDTGDVAALDGTHVARAVLDHLRAQRSLAPPLALEVEAPLRWIAPSTYRVGDGAPSRERLLLWCDRLVPFPVVVVEQRGSVVARRRLWWPAAPGRVFRVPWSIMRDVTSHGGPVRIHLGRACTGPGLSRSKP